MGHLYTIDGKKKTPKVGVTYRVECSRKGTFRLCVSEVRGEWLTGHITDGHASAINPENARAEGESVTVRAGLCTLFLDKIDSRSWHGKPIPMDRWGKDHETTLLYIEHCCVDRSGKPGIAEMRSEPGRPRRGWGVDRQMAAPPTSSPRYPTRLKDGEVFGHDDWDCASDMVAAGLLLWHGTAMQPIFELTDAGWRFASKLRRERAERLLSKILAADAAE